MFFFQGEITQSPKMGNSMTPVPIQLKMTHMHSFRDVFNGSIPTLQFDTGGSQINTLQRNRFTLHSLFFFLWNLRVWMRLVLQPSFHELRCGTGSHVVDELVMAAAGNWQATYKWQHGKVVLQCLFTCCFLCFFTFVHCNLKICSTLLPFCQLFRTLILSDSNSVAYVNFLAGSSNCTSRPTSCTVPVENPHLLRGFVE